MTTDFLGFQKIKTDKTIENYKKAIKTNNILILKNKTELESKEKQITELKTKIESLKKEDNVLVMVGRFFFRLFVFKIV